MRVAITTHFITQTNKIIKQTILAGWLVLSAILLIRCSPTQENPSFDGNKAFGHVSMQTSFGPRLPNSEAHNKTVAYIYDQLDQVGWNVSVEKTKSLGHDIENVVGRRGAGRPWWILGAHYDSRIRADNDPQLQLATSPVPGANDGASGVAILLELARVLPDDIAGQVWLVFFDAEDNGNIPGWDWILGSRAFAKTIAENPPDGVIILDMVGDSQLNLYQERNSNEQLRNEIWQVAAEIGYQNEFIPQVKYSILDDHTPFLELGIPAVDIIDFDYPYWHTTQDTLDKVSSSSLQVVGDTILEWLKRRLVAK